MSDLNLALIGCGNLGRVHAQCVAKISGAWFDAYADVSEDAARKALNDFGGRYATSDVDKIWSDDAIDAVYICTRHDSHAALAIAAAGAGKHVMIEKPLALNLADCKAVAEAVDRAGVY